MLRRLIAFVAALLLLATPVAMVVCEANCAQHAKMSTMGGQHACCPEQSSDEGAAVRSIVTLCDHPSDVPASSSQSQLVVIALPPAIAHVSAMWLTYPRTRAERVLPATADPRARTTQLRI